PVHRTRWEPKTRALFEKDERHLYHVREGFACINDLATSIAGKLKEMQALFLKEAQANHALPLDDRMLERLTAGAVGRPDLMAGRTSLTVYPGMVGMTENVFMNMKNRSFSVTADVDVPAANANGVIIAQ